MANSTSPNMRHSPNSATDTAGHVDVDSFITAANIIESQHMGLRGYTFVWLQMLDPTRSFFHPATLLYMLEVEKLGHVAFTTFFDEDEEHEPYMQYISDTASERLQYMHKMALCKEEGKGKRKGRARDGDDSAGDLAGERIVRAREDGSRLIAAKDVCINVWNNSNRRGGPLSIDDEDLNFLISHVHELRPFWGNHRSWWELRVDHLKYVSRVLERTLGCPLYYIREGYHHHHARFSSAGTRCILKVNIAKGIGYKLLNSYHSTASVFYERRSDITPVNQFRVATTRKDLCYVRDDSTPCGVFSIRTLESLVQ
ncbi:hypothetical protein OROMI_006685 [Orobanche minor]